MKRTKLVLSLALVAFAFSACEKEDSNADTNYMSEIVGTYTGQFVSQAGLKTGNQGTADVMNVNNQVQIHCYGEYMDTTFLMDAFENGDSIMICASGDAFEHEYGHMGNGGNHMMEMHNNESEWSHHMSDDHNNGDMHYGGFDMSMHTFEYKFRMMEGDSTYYLVFNGTKN